mmetsp:Transcript_1401/g.2435  ORF Transcript_1401/g.2435 Transcript_1401/m.2435 type:complete len:392 (-) Transcript_1401:73-1248(-)
MVNSIMSRSFVLFLFVALIILCVALNIIFNLKAVGVHSFYRENYEMDLSSLLLLCERPNDSREPGMTPRQLELSERNWTAHRMERQEYVHSILDAIPEQVKNEPYRGRSDKDRCSTKRKQFGDKISLVEELSPNSTKHAIIVPFRDRAYHLEQFLKYMSSYLQHHYSHTNHTFSLYILEQDDEKPFQRSFLMNAGLDFIEHDAACVTMHDVDMVPIFYSAVPYHQCRLPTNLLSKFESADWKIFYEKYMGGATTIHQQHWAVINGIGNQFRGWGAEDDELYLRLTYRALVDCKSMKPVRPKGKDGSFMAISEAKAHHHERQKKGSDYNRNVKIMNRHQKFGVSNSMIDGWSLNKYNVTAHDIRYTGDDAKLKGFQEIHFIKVSNQVEMIDF